MEYKDIDEKDNANLMATVKEFRGLLHGGVKQGVNTPGAWNLLHLLRYAEKTMKFRNLPLDHEKLGKRFNVSDFRALVLVPGQKDDQEPDDQKNVDNP